MYNINLLQEAVEKLDEDCSYECGAYLVVIEKSCQPYCEEEQRIKLIRVGDTAEELES